MNERLKDAGVIALVIIMAVSVGLTVIVSLTEKLDANAFYPECATFGNCEPLFYVNGTPYERCSCWYNFTNTLERSDE